MKKCNMIVPCNKNGKKAKVSKAVYDKATNKWTDRVKALEVKANASAMILRNIVKACKCIVGSK